MGDYKGEQDMSLSDKSRADEILNSMAEVINAPTVCDIEQIKTEIKKAVWEDTIVSLDGTDEIRIPCLNPKDVFEIIDKYKAESEDKEYNAE